MTQYGDPLVRPRNQSEIHDTYYIGELLRSRRHKHTVIGGETFYSERAMQDAFTAGKRLGRDEGRKLAEVDKAALIDDLIEELKGMK